MSGPKWPHYGPPVPRDPSSAPPPGPHASTTSSTGTFHRRESRLAMTLPYSPIDPDENYARRSARSSVSAGGRAYDHVDITGLGLGTLDSGSSMASSTSGFMRYADLVPPRRAASDGPSVHSLLPPVTDADVSVADLPAQEPAASSPRDEAPPARRVSASTPDYIALDSDDEGGGPANASAATTADSLAALLAPSAEPEPSPQRPRLADAHMSPPPTSGTRSVHEPVPLTSPAPAPAAVAEPTPEEDTSARILEELLRIRQTIGQSLGSRSSSGTAAAGAAADPPSSPDPLPRSPWHSLRELRRSNDSTVTAAAAGAPAVESPEVEVARREASPISRMFDDDDDEDDEDDGGPPVDPNFSFHIDDSLETIHELASASPMNHHPDPANLPFKSPGAYFGSKSKALGALHGHHLPPSQRPHFYTPGHREIPPTPMDRGGNGTHRSTVRVPKPVFELDEPEPEAAATDEDDADALETPSRAPTAPVAAAAAAKRAKRSRPRGSLSSHSSGSASAGSVTMHAPATHNSSSPATTRAATPSSTTAIARTATRAPLRRPPRLAVSSSHLILVLSEEYVTSLTVTNLDVSGASAGGPPRDVAFEVIWPPGRFTVFPAASVLPPGYSVDLNISSPRFPAYSRRQVPREQQVAGVFDVVPGEEEEEDEEEVDVDLWAEETQLGIVVAGQLVHSVRVTFVPLYVGGEEGVMEEEEWSDEGDSETTVRGTRPQGAV
ncbi:hypothetical protein H9P43_007846 [Blastocladiella emersonii ATCC 22665]|nr:hypothetical protein H9P43_007846 [Blastocladiella emersonii ATCC 22665]